MSNLNNGGLTRVLNYIKTWVTNLLSGKANTSHTHTKSQITDFPNIPSKTSQLTNDSGYLTSHQDLSGYVPKSGGGVLTSSSIGRNITNDGINYCGGTSTSTGAYLTVMGKDNGGYFNLVANDGTYTQNLVGYTSGSLAWSGLSFIRTVNNSELQLCGGTNYASGASVILYGKDTTSLNGMFRIRAAISGSEYTDLCGWPDGTLAWGAKHVAMYEDVIPRSGGQVLNAIEYARTTDDSYTILDGGTGWQNGAHIYVHGKNSNNGSWGLAAVNASGRMDLIGDPNGNLTWGGVDVLRRGMHNNWSHSSSFVNVAHATSAREDTGSCIDLGQPARNGVCGVWRGKSDNYTFVESLYGQTDAIWWYAMNNSDVDNSVNSPRSTMTWNGGDGTLSTNNVQANNFYCGSYRIYVG